MPHSSRAGSGKPSSCAAAGSRLDAVTNAYRLVHAEGDGLSGLVVDRFDATIVLEFFSAGMYRFRDVLQEVLAQRVSRIAGSTGSPRSTCRSRNRSTAERRSRRRRR